MFWLVLPLFILPVAVYCLAKTFRAGARVSRHTSLVTSWRWLLAAEVAVLIMLIWLISDTCFQYMPRRSSDYGWFLTSILLLCPPVAVLGARRPGVQVWSWFILVPMMLVLSWPVWTLLLQGSELRGLALELPTVLGFGLVLLLGAGNFLGTRFTFATMLYAASTWAMFLTCTGWKLLPEPAIPAVRILAVALLELSVIMATLGRSQSAPRHPVNRLWDDFRNSFGIVWALRMVERINNLAVQERWTIRLTLDGFPETELHQLTANEPEVTAACRWLFRRFVDEEWVNARLGSEA